MKKWILIIACSAVCAAIISFLKIEATSQKQVIYIKGGEPVIVDSLTRTEQLVLYTVDGKSGMFMSGDVTSVGSIRVQKKTALLSLIDHQKMRTMAAMGIDRDVARAIDSRILIFIAAFAFIWAGMALTKRAVARIQQSIARSKAATEARQAENDASAPFEQDDDEPSDLRDIAMFFLELYKLQKGAEKNAPARFAITQDSTDTKMKRFELGVKGNTDWLIRRMSVGPLGEDTGSKSKCFYVIYDTHMVVKIPPAPITDMDKYVSAIRREVQIASQLAPVTSIIPMVSVVLKKIKTLPSDTEDRLEQIEQQYIHLVEENPEYQEYLKIGNRFAFFMELSNSFFLGRVISELHKSKNRIAEEFREAPEVPWDQDAFTARYGLDSLPVFEGLHTLFQLCEKEVQRIVWESGRREQIHTFQIKNWFITAITGEALNQEERGMEAQLLAHIQEGFTSVFKAHPEYVDELTQLLRERLALKGFSQSRQQIENIATNVLVLLDQLKEKRIALRDLKPDNLFLDANPDEYPVFLNNPDSFAIGVIDVETAVSLIPNRDGSVIQPLLGGTPLYATPSHVLKNGTIGAHFGDVAQALHLQDWFAAIAIIFKAVTGRNLFRRSARSFPKVLKILKSGRSKSDPDEATVKDMSRVFWSAAAKDIKTSLTEFSDPLNQVTLALPDTMVPAISSELERETACLEAAIHKHVSFSPLFKSEKNRTFLIAASGDTIAKQIDKWKNVQNLPDQHRQVAPQMVAFLRNLNRLKWGVAEKRRALAGITTPPLQVSAHALLEAMFQIVFKAMYKSRWKTLPEPEGPTAQEAAVEENRSMVTTILNNN